MKMRKSNLSRLMTLVAVSAIAITAAAADTLGRSIPIVRKHSRSPQSSFPVHGFVERHDGAMDELIAPGTEMEKLAEGFNWSEGPTWLHRHKKVVFSDVPENVIYEWSEKDGLRVFLKPSGYTGSGLDFREQGSNGLTTDRAGNLVICQHGDRRISRYEPRSGFNPIASFYGLRKFNSPNDLVFDSRGNLYFTDPPYGLHGLNQSPLKELLFNGVYLRRPNGEVVLLTDKMSFPNGIALSPDEKTLYVNQSDSAKPVVMAFPVQPDGSIGEGHVFFDAAPLVAKGLKGMPDGLKVDVKGNLWATGPGGVLILSPAGRLMGILKTGEATGNCCWGDDGATLYITADMYLLRIRTLTRGFGFDR